MKIFLTGGTGFIGSHFLKQALSAGHEVTALRRKGSKPRIPIALQPTWLEEPFEELSSDHLKGFDVVVHLAAHSANVPYDSLEKCIHWNVTVPLRMAVQACRAGVHRFIVAGSCFEYGLAGEKYEWIPPDAPLEPTLSYPTSKAAASVAWSGFSREYGTSVSILRIFQVYGEGEAAGRLWPSIIAAAKSGADYPMTQGEQVRDFILVEDVAQNFVRELGLQPAGLSVRNVGTGKPQTVAEFARAVWAQQGASGKLIIGALPYRANEVMRFVPLVRPS